MEGKKCRNCIYWDYFNTKKDDVDGECHRWAPKPHTSTITTDNNYKKFRTNSFAVTVWPSTFGEGFCGEWVSD